MDQKVVDADRMLKDHFTAAVGGKAQRYEPATSGGDTAPEEIILAPWRSRERRTYALVESVLNANGINRRVLRLVYAYGTDALSSETDEHGIPMAGKPSGLVAGKNNSPDPHGLLRYALAPSWGHGSFLRLAVGQGRALRAFGKRYRGLEPTYHAVLDFLAFEAGRGTASDGMLAEIRNECQAVRDEALTAFADCYGETMKSAGKRRDEASKDEQRAADKAFEAARLTRESGRLPVCLVDVVAEKRERLRSAALALLADLEVEA